MGWRRYGSLHELKATLVTEATNVTPPCSQRRHSRVSVIALYRRSTRWCSRSVLGWSLQSVARFVL